MDSQTTTNVINGGLLLMDCTPRSNDGLETLTRRKSRMRALLSRGDVFNSIKLEINYYNELGDLIIGGYRSCYREYLALIMRSNGELIFVRVEGKMPIRPQL